MIPILPDLLVGPLPPPPGPAYSYQQPQSVTLRAITPEGNHEMRGTASHLAWSTEPHKAQEWPLPLTEQPAPTSRVIGGRPQIPCGPTYSPRPCHSPRPHYSHHSNTRGHGHSSMASEGAAEETTAHQDRPMSLVESLYSAADAEALYDYIVTKVVPQGSTDIGATIVVRDLIIGDCHLHRCRCTNTKWRLMLGDSRASCVVFHGMINPLHPNFNLQAIFTTADPEIPLSSFLDLRGSWLKEKTW